MHKKMMAWSRDLFSEAGPGASADDSVEERGLVLH